MKRLLFTITLFGLGFSAQAMKFGCTYRDTYKVQKRGKIKTYNDRSPLVSLYGNFNEGSGGRFRVKSYFLFGDVGNSKSYQKFYFHRQYRKGESGFKFAKYANKSPAQQKVGKWIPTYVRFSIPKDAFAKTKGRKFTGYFGYFHSKEDLSSDQREQIELNTREMEEFKRENDQEIEYKMTCTVQ